jgi:hypothetical protein
LFNGTFAINLWLSIFYYCEGKWKEFKDSWTKELVDAQSNVEVAVPVVEVSDKTICYQPLA